MKNYSKSVKQEIRSLISKLYERELNLELKSLGDYFTQWKDGNLSPFELSEHIHKFHQYPSRELFNKYQNTSLFPLFIASGLVNGLLDRSEISEQTLSALEGRIEMVKMDFKN